MLIDSLKRDPVIVQECRAVLVNIEAQMVPANENQLRNILTELAVVFGVPWEDSAVQDVAMGIYIRTLQGFPYSVLCGARDHVFATHKRKVYPVPALIYDAAQAIMAPLRLAVWRAKCITGVN